MVRHGVAALEVVLTAALVVLVHVIAGGVAHEHLLLLLVWNNVALLKQTAILQFEQIFVAVLVDICVPLHLFR